MAITPEQARKELARRELARRESLKQPEKGFLRKTAESIVDSPALPIAGGIAGGIAGIPLGPGAIATSGAGGAAGEAYRQLAARALGMESPSTPLEAAKDIGIEGASQAAGEALGMGAGKALSAAAKTGAGKAVVSGTKKTAGDLFQIVTKMKPEDAATLFENPGAILPSAWKKAKEGWRIAAKKIGIPVDDVSPEIIKALKDDAKKTIFDTFEKLSNNEAVSASEAQIANQALRMSLIPAAKNEKNKGLIAMYEKMGDAFKKRISAESPEMATANKDYAIASVGKKFRSLFPRNMNDSPAYFRSSILPSILTGAGAYRGDPIEGALQGAAVTGLSSPLAIGGLIALASGARGIAPYARKTLTSSLAALAAEKLKDR